MMTIKQRIPAPRPARLLERGFMVSGSALLNCRFGARADAADLSGYAEAMLTM